MSLIPVILSGGSGTRLWPLSRKAHPKQFIDFYGNGSLFDLTLKRAQDLPGSAAPYVICGASHLPFILDSRQYAAMTKDPGARHVFLEPMGRNTGPAIALCALAALQAQPDPRDEPVLLVLTADHSITPQDAFNTTIATAVPAAEAGNLVVFGVRPTRPETGFGYIRRGKETAPGVYSVDAFVEKPNLDKATAMLQQGGYYWNSGMFLFRASVFLDELRRYAPDVYACCLKVWEKHTRQEGIVAFDADSFAATPDISIDYAVMERTDRAVVTPLLAEWADLGSWQAIHQAGEKDEAGNVHKGDILQLDSRNNLFFAGNKRIVAIGMENTCVIETDSLILVMPLDRSQDVKRLQSLLKDSGELQKLL
jgi:mannose-1-phosphate guanylyltransferase/mannose-6-phosphate isomerase